MATKTGKTLTVSVTFFDPEKLSLQDFDAGLAYVRHQVRRLGYLYPAEWGEVTNVKGNTIGTWKVTEEKG